MSMTLKQILKLPTKRLLAYYRAHRFDTEVTINDADYICPDWRHGNSQECEYWRSKVYTKQDHIEAVKAELDTREHVAFSSKVYIGK